MTKRGFATGHGDTIEDLHREFWWQLDERLANKTKLSDLSDDALILIREMLADQWRLGFEYACEQAGVNCTNRDEALAIILSSISPSDMRAMMVHREKLEQEKQTNG